jgi:hypothetical protein
MESTTMILRKEVIEISRKGSNDIMDRESNIWTLLLKAGEFMTPVILTPARIGAAAYER